MAALEVFHLDGQHDQKAHGRRGGASALEASDIPVYSDAYGELLIESTGVDRIRQVAYDYDGGSDVFDVVIVEQDDGTIAVDVENLYGITGTVEGEQALEQYLNDNGIYDVRWDGERGSLHATPKAAVDAGDATTAETLLVGVQDVYDGEFSTPDGRVFVIGETRYLVQGSDRVPYTVEVRGSIFEGDVTGRHVGDFSRSVHDDGVVYNHSLTIRPEELGNGIGTAFLEHTEGQLDASEYRLAAVNVGKYAWASRGYKLDIKGSSALAASIRDSWAGAARARLGSLSPEDRVRANAVLTGWSNDLDGVYPSDLLAIDSDVFRDVFLDGPSWDGVRQTGGAGLLAFAGVEVFHLQGQHDQQSHAGGGARNPNLPEAFGTVREVEKGTNRRGETVYTHHVENSEGYSIASFSVTDADDLWDEYEAEDAISGLADAWALAPTGPDVRYGRTDQPPSIDVMSRMSAAEMLVEKGAPRRQALEIVDDVYAFTMTNDPDTIVFVAGADRPFPDTDQWMSSAKDVSPQRYTAAHEYGHIRVIRDADPKALVNSTRRAAVGTDWKSMSNYGKTSEWEAHAETFADFVTTGGSSTNPMTQLYNGVFEWDDMLDSGALAAAAGDDVELPLMIGEGATGPVYLWADDTVTAPKVELATEQFHANHDQQSHAGGRRRKPIPPPPRRRPQRPQIGGPLPDVEFDEVKVAYRPRHPDGKADPGEIVWAQIPFEENPSRSKDRPVLVIGTAPDEDTLVAVQLTSKNRRGRLPIGSGDWDRSDRPSFLKTDRFVQIDEANYRREGAYMKKPQFQDIVDVLTAQQGVRDIDLALEVFHLQGGHDQQSHAGGAATDDWEDRRASSDGTEREEQAARIYSGTFEVDGYPFGIETVSTRADNAGVVKLEGRIRDGDEDGGKVGQFMRTVKPNGDLVNDVLIIDEAYRGQGIGTAFLDHTEGLVREEYGTKTIEVGAVEDGRYAWAARGYGTTDPAVEVWQTKARRAVANGALGVDNDKYGQFEALMADWTDRYRSVDFVYPADLIALSPRFRSVFTDDDSPDWRGVKIFDYDDDGRLPRRGDLAVEVFHLQGEHDQQSHAGGRGGDLQLDGLDGFESVHDLDGEFTDASPERVAERFDLYDGDQEYLAESGGRIYRAPDGAYVILDEDGGTWVTVEPDLYSVDIDTAQLETDVEESWREDVVRGPVYHGTRDDESMQSILSTGLETRNETRGINNRWVGSSVFTSTNSELARAYGNVVEVDLPRAIADGVIDPNSLSREPGYNQADAESMVAYGFDDYSYDPYGEFIGTGEDPSTVIIGADIPPEYITPGDEYGQFAVEVFHLQGEHDQQSHAGGSATAGQYQGTAAAKTQEIADRARQGLDPSDFDGPLMSRGIAITVDDDLKRRLDTQIGRGADPSAPEEFNQHLELGPEIAEQLLDFEGHQGGAVERTAGFGQSWTTNPEVAESVHPGSGQNLVVKVVGRPRQSDVLYQEIEDADGRHAGWVDADGNSIERGGRGADMIPGEMEVRIDGRSPVDIVDIQVRQGSRWESIWGDERGFGAGADELYRQFPHVKDWDLAVEVFHLQGEHDQQSHAGGRGQGGDSSWRSRDREKDGWWTETADGEVISWNEYAAATSLANYADAIANGSGRTVGSTGDTAKFTMRYAPPEAQERLQPIYDEVQGSGMGSAESKAALETLDSMYRPAGPPTDEELAEAVQSAVGVYERLPDIEADGFNLDQIRNGSDIALAARQSMYRTGTRAERAVAIGVETWSGSMVGVSDFRTSLANGYPEAEAFVEAIRSGPETTMTLHRGMSPGRNPAQWDGIAAGDVISLDQIGSFTEFEGHADFFGEDISLRLRPGARALPIAGLSNTPGEREWLVAGDVRVVGVADDFGDLTIDVEYVGDADREDIALAAAASKALLDEIAEQLGRPLRFRMQGAAGVEEFHLQGQHDQQSHAGGRGQASYERSADLLITDPLADIAGYALSSDDASYAVSDPELRAAAKFNGPIQIAEQMTPLEQRMVEEGLGTYGGAGDEFLYTLVEAKQAGRLAQDIGLEPDKYKNIPLGQVFQAAHVAAYIEALNESDFQLHQTEMMKAQSIIDEFHMETEGTNGMGEQFDDAVANLSYELESQFGVSPAAGFVGALNRSWTESSQGHLSQAHQIAIANVRGYEFAADGTPESMDWLYSHPEYPQGLKNSRQLYSDWQPAFDATARATYRHTQSVLPDGPVSLYRGVRGMAAVNTEFGDYAVEINPLSSWSASPDTAYEFGDYVFEVQVPREMVYSTSSVSGLGSLPEWEVVVTADDMLAARLVNRDPMTDEVVSLDEMYENIGMATEEDDRVVVRVDELDADWLRHVRRPTVATFHLQGQHDQQSHAGGRGKNSTGLDYDPRTEIPTKRPGEAKIPEGAVRLSHRTWTTNLDSILEKGLEARDAGDGSGDAVWAAAGVGVGGEKPGGPWQAESDIAFVEFWAMPNELGVGNNQDPAWLEERSAHVTMGAMPPERIVGAYVPWHAAYWGFESRATGTFDEVNSGFYDSIGRDYPETYGRAIDYIKSQSQDEELSVEVFHLQGEHDQQSHAGGRRANDDGETIQDVGKTIPEKRDPDDVLDEWRATPEEFAAAQKLAAEKAKNVPKPTQAQIEKNQEMLAKSKRPGGWGRGNSYTRRARGQALFEEFGGTPGGYCPCGHCGIKVSPKGEGGFAKMTQDKILTAAEGGTYGTVKKGFPNLIPACGGCNSSRNQEAYYIRPDWDEEPLAASAGFGEDVATGEEYVAARAVGRPLGWDDWLAPEVGTEPVEGEYVIRSVDTWFGPYDQHLIDNDVCDPETIEVPEDGELALEVFHLQGEHDQQSHAGGRGGTAVLDSPADALVAGENVTVTGAEAADLLVEIGKADNGVVDLTNMTIEGDPYLFRGVEESGIRERGDMPQVPERALDAFHDHLEAEGVTFNKEQIDPRSVKSTQTNLDATKVGQMIARVRDGSYTTGHDPWISNDGFILDGHHRWGTMAVMSAAGEEHPAFNVTRVSLPIDELLVMADDFNAENDIDSKTIDMAVQEAFRADFRAEFHLDGQHDQQSHAGGRSKASNDFEVPEGATVVEDDAWAEREGNERLSGEGDCYPTANLAVWDKVGTADEDNWHAVHGVVTGQGELEGVRFGHAWAEETQRFPVPENILESGTPEQRAAWENMTFTIVHDTSNGNNISMPAEMYYGVGQIDAGTVQRYTPAEVGRNMVNSGHHGPWEDEDL